MKYKCVIFDCDGTLVDTLGDIAASMNQSLALHGFPTIPEGQYRAMVGWGMERLASLALPQAAKTDEAVQAVAAEATRIYCGQPLARSAPYPGMRELVAELRAKKIKTAVLSNKPQAVLQLVIDGLFAPGAFDAVRGERPGGGRKPDPNLVWDLLAAIGRSPRDTVLAGDSEVDIETAINAGCFPLGVSWGFRPRSTIEAAGAARVIDTPGQIWDLLEVVHVMPQIKM